MQWTAGQALWNPSILLAVIIFSLALPLKGQEQENEIEVLKRRVEELESEMNMLRLLNRGLRNNQPPAIGEVHCEKEGYEVISAQGGTFRFLVGCKDVSSFLEGHKVKIEIGNPYYADFDGVTVFLRYGPEMLDSYEEDRLVSVPISDRLRAGEWNDVSVVINPSSPNELRYLTVELKVDGTILRTRSD